jgi:hypothetical protein
VKPPIDVGPVIRWSPEEVSAFSRLNSDVADQAVAEWKKRVRPALRNLLDADPVHPTQFAPDVD